MLKLDLYTRTDSYVSLQCEDCKKEEEIIYEDSNIGEWGFDEYIQVFHEDIKQLDFYITDEKKILCQDCYADYLLNCFYEKKR